MEYPRILVISHTSFTKANSMGSTLASYFTGYDPNCMAQFYIKEMTPDIPVCRRYFCTTDNEIVRKLLHPFTSTVGKAIELNEKNEILEGKTATRSSAGGSRHRDLALLMRKILWSTRTWYNKRFREWIADFSPQIILVQPGDFSYLLDMGVFLSKKLDIPVIVHQSESYYLKEYEKKTPLYRLFRYDFKRAYERLMTRTSCCVYLCEALERDYGRFFDVPAETIMKATNTVPAKSGRSFDRNNVKFIYGGNLGEAVGRCGPLAELGREVRKLGHHIDVYTFSTGVHMSELTPENGIILHGSIPYDQLQEEIKNSDFVLHIESQDPWHIKDLEYAFSTKIADMLASGVCSIVYGSDRIASVRYFKEHSLACVIERQEDIAQKLREVIDDSSLRNGYIDRALDQAAKEHSPDVNSERMRRIVCMAVDKEFASQNRISQSDRNAERA